MSDWIRAEPPEHGFYALKNEETGAIRLAEVSSATCAGGWKFTEIRLPGLEQTVSFGMFTHHMKLEIKP